MSIERFREAYEPALRAAVENFPDEYGYGVEHVPGVVDKMLRAIGEGSFNHAGRALKGACKALGIKHTQKAIRAFCFPDALETPVAKPIPLIQSSTVANGRTVLVVAQDATREEIDAILVERGVDPAEYARRLRDTSRPMYSVHDWLRKEHGLSLVPGSRRS